MLSKSVNNGPCIIFYDARVCSSTCEIKQKPYKYINILKQPPSKTMTNITDLGLTSEIHVNKEDNDIKLDTNIKE